MNPDEDPSSEAEGRRSSRRERSELCVGSSELRGACRGARTGGFSERGVQETCAASPPQHVAFSGLLQIRAVSVLKPAPHARASDISRTPLPPRPVLLTGAAAPRWDPSAANVRLRPRGPPAVSPASVRPYSRAGPQFCLPRGPRLCPPSPLQIPARPAL